MYILDINEVGSDVVATGSGSIDLTGLTFFNTYTVSGAGKAGIFPRGSTIVLGERGTESRYQGGTSVSAFGTGGSLPTELSTGSPVGLLGSAGNIVVPADYVSATQLGISTATFAGQTLSSLGLTRGIYTSTWGEGATADSFTVYIGVAPPADVPAPAALGLLGLGALTVAARRRRSAKA